MKKTLALLLSLALSVSFFAGCGDNGGNDDDKGSVYYLAFKPEQDEAFKEIAKEYTALTGVEVKVTTAASGTYEQTLKSEMAKKDAPTLFQINGPVGYAAWADYCADVTDTEVYKHLLDKSIAVKDGDKAYGIPYVIEGYGIIYNKAIMDKYTALDGAKVASADEIVSYDVLKSVVEDMQAKKADLGIDGVFASTSLAPGEDWRWQTHLANVPLFYEWSKNETNLGDKSATAEIDFTYGDGFKNLFDLYIDNSTVAKTLLGSKTVNDSMAEFALGQAAMVQNGNWAYGQISGVEGNVVKAEDVGYLPMFIGADGEEGQGICIGTENFLSINEKASDADKKATEDFIAWLYTSDAGMKLVSEKLGFIAPFDTFTDDLSPADPLAQEVLKWSANADAKNVPWNFTVFPSQAFKDNFGANLLEYAQGTKDWADVASAVVSDWKTESAN